MLSRKALFLVTVLVVLSLSLIIIFYVTETKGWNFPPLTQYSAGFPIRNEAVSKVASITLQRFGCHGTCAVYTTKFEENGNAEYVGEQYVRMIGTYHGQTNEFPNLVSWMDSIDIAEIKEKCNENPEVSLTVAIRGKPLTITTCDPTRAPLELQAVFRAIDDIASRINWHKQG